MFLFVNFHYHGYQFHIIIIIEIFITMEGNIFLYIVLFTVVFGTTTANQFTFEIWERNSTSNFRQTLMRATKSPANNNNFTIKNFYNRIDIVPDRDCDQTNEYWFTCVKEDNYWLISGVFTSPGDFASKARFYTSPWEMSTLNDEGIEAQEFFDTSMYQVSGENVPNFERMYITMHDVGVEGNYRIFGCSVLENNVLWRPNSIPPGKPHDLYLPFYAAGYTGIKGKYYDDVYQRYTASRFSYINHDCTDSERNNHYLIETLDQSSENATKFGHDFTCTPSSCFQPHTTFWMTAGPRSGHGEVTITEPILFKATQWPDVPNAADTYQHPSMINQMMKIFIEGVKGFNAIKTYDISVNGVIPTDQPELTENEEILAYLYTKPSCAGTVITEYHNPALSTDPTCSDARRVYTYEGAYTSGMNFMNLANGDCTDPHVVVFYKKRPEATTRRMYVIGFYQQLADMTYPNPDDRLCYNYTTKRAHFLNFPTLTRTVEDVNGWVGTVKTVPASFPNNYKQRINRCPLGDMSFTVGVPKNDPDLYRCVFIDQESVNAFQVTSAGGLVAVGSPDDIPTFSPPTTEEPTTTPEANYTIRNETLHVMNDRMKEVVLQTIYELRIIVYVGIPTGMGLFLLLLLLLLLLSYRRRQS